MIMVGGYPPGNINFCPECGSPRIEFSDHWNDGSGLLVCEVCGLQCYIVDDENSHADQ